MLLLLLLLFSEICLVFSSLYSALIHIEDSESVLSQFWSLHQTRLQRCLALRQFEENFKTFQCHFIQLLHEINQLPDLNTSLHLVDCARIETTILTPREEIDQTLNRIDNLSESAQVKP